MKFLRKRLFRLGLSLVLVLAVILGTSIDIGPSVKGSNGIVSLSVNTAVAATPQEGPKPYRPPPQPIIKGEVVNPKPLAYTTTLTDSPTANTGGNWTNPTYAYASDTNYATQNSNGGYNTYGTYGNNITSGNVVTQVRVRADAFENNHASSQSKAITGNDANTGGFTFTGGASLWESLNDASDATYDTGVTNGGGYCTVAFTAFSIPAGSVITNLALHYRHRSATTGTACNSGTVIKVNGTYYGLGGTLNAYTDNGTSSEPGSGSAIADRTYNWTKNPNTGATWTVADINGTGSAPLQFIGVGGSDFNPDVNFYKLDATVNYTSAPDDAIRLTVSWDGGTSWSANQSSTLSTSKATYWDNFTSATTWTRAKVNDTNFKVRVDSTTTGDVDTISLDWLPAEVTYDAIGAPTSFTSTSRTSGSIALSWTKGANADNTSVRYRTDVYPTGTGDGTSAYNGTGTSVNVTGLSAGQVYYLRAWSYNNTEAEYSSSYAQLTDYTLPADPSNLASSGVGDNNIVYSWTKGTGGDKTLLRYKTGAFPSSTSDGTQAYFDTGTSTNVTGLVVGTTYYFRAWAYDSDSTYYSAGTSDNIQATTGTAWLTGYGYRKDFTITGTTAGNQTNYQMPFEARYDDYYLTSRAQGAGIYANNQPAAAYYNGYTYLVFQGPKSTGDGDPYITRYNHSTGYWDAPVKIGTNPLPANDYHGAPCVLIRTDTGHVGKILVVYGGHGTYAPQWVESTNAEDITAWGTAASLGIGSFPQLVQVASGDIYAFFVNFATGDDRLYSYQKMSAGGTSWGAVTNILDWTANGGDATTEIMVRWPEYDSASDKIWFSCGQENYPFDGYETDRYAFAFRPTDGKIYDIAGNNFATTVPKTTFDNASYKFKLYTRGANENTMLGILRLDPSKNPHVVFGVYDNSTTLYSYEYSSWNGTAWSPSPTTITSNTTSIIKGFSALVVNSTTNINVYLSGVDNDCDLWHWDGASWSKTMTVLDNSTEPDAYYGTNGQSPVMNGTSALEAVFSRANTAQENMRIYAANATGTIDWKAKGYVTLGGHALSNFNDLRFTASDGVTPLPYWIDTYTASQYAIGWVKVAFIQASPSTTTIYAYYGKSDASAGSNGPDTFPFFDHFDGDMSKWTKTGATGNAAISGSNVTFTATDWSFWIGNVTQQYGALHFRGALTKAGTPGSGKYTIGGWSVDISGTNAAYWQWTTDTAGRQFQTWRAASYTHTDNLGGSDGTMYDWDIYWKSSQVKAYRKQYDSVLEAAHTTNLPNAAIPVMFAVNSANPVIVDLVYLRNWVDPEPTWTTSGNETPFLVITNAPTTKDFGVVSESSTYYAKGSAPSNPVVNGDCTFLITNSGVTTINLLMKGFDFEGGSGWTLTSGAPGSNTVRITTYYSGENPASGIVLTTSNQAFYNGLSASSTLYWDFKMETGTFTDGIQKQGRILITAAAP